MDPLEEQFAQLKKEHGSATLDRRSDGTALVAIPGFPLPSGWNVPSVDVYFLVPLGYPVARPDCFWTDASLRLLGGSMPANTGSNSGHGLSSEKLWFSWHASTWNPSLDDLLTYSHLIRTRLRDVR